VQGNEMPTHFYAVAACLKGVEADESKPMESGVLRWRLYTEKLDPCLNTTHPTQSRSCRSNNDFKAAIDKFGLVNYVAKAAHYISKPEKSSKVRQSPSRNAFCF
jgi:hypothetical protein